MKRARAEDGTEKAMAFITQNPEGVTQSMLEEEMGLSAEGILQLTNSLLQSNLVDMFERGNEGQLVFKLKDAGQAMKFKNLTAEDMLVYQVIQSGKNQGIWSRDVKRKTNLTQTSVTRILKTLESRNLVKPVRSVNDGKRKIYVLYDLEPAADITGGLWFSGQELDVEFIDTLKQQCKRYISEKGTATASQLERAIQKSAIFKVPVTEDQLSLILQTLKYEGILEHAPSSEEEETWQIAKHKLPSVTSFTSFPCGVCPVISQCTPGGLVSPEKCLYFDEYLQF